jgi:hypothetical protein
VDIEGHVVNLMKMRDEVFSKVPEHIVKVDSDDLFRMMVDECAGNGYEIVYVSTTRSLLRIVYARKKERVRE